MSDYTVINKFEKLTKLYTGFVYKYLKYEF